MTTLGKAIKKATGMTSTKKSMSVYTSTTTTPNTSEVVYKFDNKLFSKEVSAVSIKTATQKRVSSSTDLPGSTVSADL